MTFPRRLLTALLLTLTLLAPLSAQERGLWRAVSKTAQSITGDIALNNDRLTLNFSTFSIAEIRPLKPEEILAAFSEADPATANGHLFRLSIPGDKRLLHKNTLCGTEETQWMATAVSGKELSVIFFSNATPPVLTVEALNTTTNLCGIFAYKR